MGRMRTILVDDEEPVRKRFRQMLGLEPLVTLVGEAATAAEAHQLLLRQPCDLVFLDIVMPGADGFSLIDRIPAAVAVVFVTAHEEFARRAFDVAAVDYLLKPVDPGRLRECLCRVQARLATIAKDAAIRLEEGDRVRQVPAGAIIAVEKFRDSTVRIHVAGDVPAIVGGRIGQWADWLAMGGLVRIDRGLAIRPDAVVHQERLSRNEMVIEMHGGKTFRLGRTAAVRVNQILRDRSTAPST